MKQFNDAQHASTDPPAHIADLWSRWLQSQGFTGSLQDLEFAYFQSKGYENWSEYLKSLSYRLYLSFRLNLMYLKNLKNLKNLKYHLIRLNHLYLMSLSYRLYLSYLMSLMFR